MELSQKKKLAMKTVKISSYEKRRMALRTMGRIWENLEEIWNQIMDSEMLFMLMQELWRRELNIFSV